MHIQVWARFGHKNNAQSQSQDPMSKNPLGLNIIYPIRPSNIPAKPSSGLQTIDIIFVHGLGGLSRGTWTHPETQGFWPLWLPEVEGLENVRISLFGYNSALPTPFSVRNALGIADFAGQLLDQLVNKYEAGDTPTIFVAHSLGGLVVKKTIIEAHAQNHPNVVNNTKGIIFIGTPHNGAPKAELLAQLFSHTLGNRDYMKQLEPGCETIMEINNAFPNRARNMQLISFYESSEMGGLLGLIVPRSSAMLSYGDNSRCVALNGDHIQIVKYSSPDDSNYRSISDNIASMVRRISSELNSGSILKSPSENSLSTPLLIWVDDQPEHNEELLKHAKALHLQIKLLKSTREAKEWIQNNLEFLRRNDTGDRVRFISDQVRFEMREDGTTFNNRHAGEEIVVYIRALGLNIPIIVFASSSTIPFTDYVKHFHAAGSTCKPSVIWRYIDGLAGKNDSSLWARFNSGNNDEKPAAGPEDQGKSSQSLPVSKGLPDPQSANKSRVDKNLSAPMRTANTIEPRGEPDEATEYWKMQVMQSPGNVIIQQRLVDAFRRTGRYDEAVTFWKTLVDRHRGNPILQSQLDDAFKMKAAMESTKRF